MVWIWKGFCYNTKTIYISTHTAMEKWCILPHSEIKKIDHPENIVISQLARFCKSSWKEILDALKLRNQEKTDDKQYIYGYKRYNKTLGKKTRTIRNPHPQLHKIQEAIKKHLMTIPVSLSSTQGKPGDNASKNTEIHRHNPYLLTLDIKNAYPSITTKRVYANLFGSIHRNLDIWCPLLEKEEDKKTFIRALTHLCMSENELPQWSPTSNHIQNIVLASTDAAIERQIPQLIGHNTQYSRYADDIAISFPYMTTMSVLQENFQAYIKQLEEIQQSQKTQEEQKSNLQEEIQQSQKTQEEQKSNLQNILESFKKETFHISDKYELQYLRENIKSIKDQIKDIGNKILSEEELYQAIGTINQYKKQIEYTWWRMSMVREPILQTIGKQWWKINAIKLSTRTPQSNTDREINKLAFDKNGKRKLATKSKEAYSRLFNDLYTKTREELRENTHYRYTLKPKHGKVPHNSNDPKTQKAYAENIINKLEGMWWYIIHVYEWEENISKNLRKEYFKAHSKRSKIKTGDQPITPPEDKQTVQKKGKQTDPNDIPF